MAVGGCSQIAGGVSMIYEPPNLKTYNPASKRSSQFPPKVTFSGINSSWGPCRKLSCSSNGMPHLQLAAASSSFSVKGGLSYAIPLSPNQQQSFVSPRALYSDLYSSRPPPMTEKPRWWWRTISCLPYLTPLCLTWAFSEPAFHLHPFLENVEHLALPFLQATLWKMPGWLEIAYLTFLQLGVVRRKEWPHFFRFHILMATLLQMALHIVVCVCQTMPLAMFWSRIGMHIWVGLAFAYMFLVMECMRCALGGMYADIPFFCDAAYMQVPYLFEEG